MPATAEELAAELEWLKAHPEFSERPATLVEFLGPDYLNTGRYIRKTIRRELSNIMGEEVSATRPTAYHLAMMTGGIGIGKTTVASVVLPYLAHWVLCLRDPQDFFDLLPGSRIAFMQMSTSESQAREVIFADIKARINHSPWFKKFPHDPAYKNQLRFPKDIWIIPGDSAETSFEGYNILGGILDEADSHKITVNRDYAEDGYNTIHARITSRFSDRGFLLVIGQMKSASGFAARKYAEMLEDPSAYAVRLSLWDSMGRDYYADENGNVDVFFYDTKRKQIVPKEVASFVTDSDNLIEIPKKYLKDFKNNPVKALRDLAGIPPAVGDPFISQAHKIVEAQERWDFHHDGLGSPVLVDGSVAPWFHALETLKRIAHVDLAYSAQGDALGFAMGHVSEVVERDGEMKPYIVMDLLMRVKALPGSEIFLGDIRRFIYRLKDEFGFKLGTITMDGFESTDTRQQLQRRRFTVDDVSVDKTKLPYHDLSEAIYEDRIEFPRYLVNYKIDDTNPTDIVYKELSELMDMGRKIDHPPKGSKDVADAIAGVCYTLMGDRKYRKKVVSMEQVRHQRLVSGGGIVHPAYLGDSGASAPIPPSMNPTGERQPYGSSRSPW